MIPKISSLFGRDAAVKEFKDFYSVETVHNNNKYTDVLKDMNIIFVHMESIQSFLIDLNVNDQEITPTLNWLTRNGLFFDHFYPQISIGTSSDTEFTLNTSLMPANSGTVFVSYNNRKFVAIPQILSDMGYYTFSSHANQSSMWNRNVMHPRLGYQELIFKDQFDIGDDDSDPRWLGLGLNDVDWFLQLEPKLEKIEDEHERYMGTILQLSNHSPFAATPYNKEGYDYFGRLDLTNTYINKKGNEVTDDYLDDTDLGNYLRSAHYGDMALGTFLDYIKNNPDYYNNTVFVFYGDHYAKLAKKEFQYYYNYDTETGSVRREGDDGYVNYDNFANDLNKNTPLIIWTKNEDVMRKLKGVNHNVMGMYDVLPTIGNMMGFSSKYALGHDIYDTKDNNVVIFPSGDFITNKVYYSATTGSYVTIPQADGSMPVIDEDYISKLKEYAEKRLSVSNDIIVFDLIKEDLEEGSQDNGEISGN
jgi:phosphoglycerol transferase MdoB-like AlkP superfamily enzyme